MQIDIPDERCMQVASAFRSKADEFHGWVARAPQDSCVPAWSASAAYFDNLANTIINAYLNPYGKTTK